MPISDLLILSLRVLFLAVVPVVIGVSVVGAIVSALQAATSINDPSIGYAARLIAAIVIILAMYPLFSRSLATLAEAALH